MTVSDNNGGGSFQHFANMAAAFQDHPLPAVYSSIPSTNELAPGPPMLLPAYSLADDDDNRFIDQFSIGARIHSSSSNSINSQPFSPPENPYPIAIARGESTNGSRPSNADSYHNQQVFIGSSFITSLLVITFLIDFLLFFLDHKSSPRNLSPSCYASLTRYPESEISSSDFAKDGSYS